jgi:hypothetical protein
MDQMRVSTEYRMSVKLVEDYGGRTRPIQALTVDVF